jgi:hypothetical protein
VAKSRRGDNQNKRKKGEGLERIINKNIFYLNMEDLIKIIENNYTLIELDKTRLKSEYELIVLRVDFCLSKFQQDNKNFYNILKYYAGLERFTKYLSDDEKNKLNDTINSFENKIRTGHDESDKLDFCRELFLNSDYTKDICNHKQEKRCFNYDIWNNEGVSLHFTNAVIPKNPFKEEQFDLRKSELKEIANEIKEKYPEIKFFFSVSWMWNLNIFKKLMPKEFNDSLEEFNEHDFYSLGHWGQFFRHDGTLNYKRFEEFRKNWEFPFKVLLGKCDKNEFFEMYLK